MLSKKSFGKHDMNFGEKQGLKLVTVSKFRENEVWKKFLEEPKHI